MRNPDQIQALQQRVDQSKWYHKIDLGDGVITPGHNFDAIWANIRKVRDHIDYAGKSVLDLGSMEGMWSFEAEKLGAARVVATDCIYTTGFYDNMLEKFLFCREQLGSKILPYYNVSPYALWSRLDLLLHEGEGAAKPYGGLFDIVQHMGILYHLRDPLLSLAQARSVLKHGGHMLVETGLVADREDSCMVFNGVPPNDGRIYKDLTTWWAPTLPCLYEMLRASLLEPIESTVAMIEPYPHNGNMLTRAAVVCKAVGAESVSPEYYEELARTYRNPGLCAEIFFAQNPG